MNVLEVFGLAFIALVVINLTSMIWAIKHARLYGMQYITEEQEL